MYSYTSEVNGASSSVVINVFDGKKIQALSVNLSSLKVEGHTSGEWVYTGEYTFTKGAKKLY
ncbi:MAG: hypothetical protein WDO19_02915 [Bacteroidota bacterium]